MKNKMLSLVLTLMVALTACMPVAMAGTPTSFVDLPSGYTALNVRSGPGTNYSVSGWVIDGDEIDLLSIGDTWTKIQVLRSGRVGYIKNAYIDDLQSGGSSSAPSTPSTSGTATAGRVTGSGVNMRKGPGTSYAKVTTLYSGTPLKLWDSSGNWYYASTLGGTKGWISKTYVATGYTARTSARVNLRQSPNGTLIRTLSTGTQVTVQSITGTWSKVKVGSTTGYVFSKYLR